MSKVFDLRKDRLILVLQYFPMKINKRQENRSRIDRSLTTIGIIYSTKMFNEIKNIFNQS